MRADSKYGKITTERGEFFEDEPVFLFRASDPLSYHAIRRYIEMCDARGCSLDHVKAVAEAAKQIRRWQLDNAGLVKDKPGRSGRRPAHTPPVQEPRRADVG